MSDRPEPAQRRTILAGIGASAIGTLLLWAVLLLVLPDFRSFDSFTVAVQCCAVAALLTLLVGVNAIAHERLVTKAIDPLAGVETPRMRVNARYLSNTVEQFILFAAGLLAISAYVGPRIVVGLAIVWILNRWAFWIGYHRGPLMRGIGAIGVLQSLLVLAYASWRFGMDAFGLAGALAIAGAFVVIEALLFRSVLRGGQ